MSSVPDIGSRQSDRANRSRSVCRWQHERGTTLMNYRNASAPVRPVSRTLAAIAKALGQASVLAITLTLANGSFAVAQQAAPAATAKPKPGAPAAAKKPVAPAPAAPEAQQPAAPPQAQAEQQQQPQLIYSPWTKFCLKNNNDPNAKQVCFTGKDARIEFGNAGGRRRADRAGRRAEENPARHLAARHAAHSRHARHRRSEPADDRALCDLLHQRLHGRL